ncbi:hypothetical protein [Sphingomonas immobilis]|uniref:Uncharacterized protein n=1 Tax=Sphingomonas immobilis TaxID=3063997 RepID=A0ABT9A1S4_9SPHN|nr:hypothetical protein [Sphingomonas sp. CA1-15]MDO7843766.1 hypothetical protein [Sphingomonas sp. CA1-15]
MKDIQKHDPNRRPADDIQDAEFVEIDDTGTAKPGRRSPNPTPLNEPRPSKGWSIWKIWLALSPFFILTMCVASLRLPPTAGNVAEASSDTEESQAAGATDLPPAAELIVNNDARVCGHPDIVALIRDRVLPVGGGDHNMWGLSQAELDKAVTLARVDLTEVSAGSIHSETHEIDCDANLRYGDTDTDVAQINYKIRAAADPAKPPVVFYKFPVFLTFSIMKNPVATVEAERSPPPQAEPTKNPVSQPESVETPQSEQQPKEPTDEQLFSPVP